MSNPYTQPSISGYNTSPPSNDGAATSNNQVDWDKHKTKLGDPIKTFAEGIDAATLAAFGLVFGAAVREVSSSTSVATGDRGRFISATGTSILTLPAVATAGTGFPVAVVNTGTGIVTLDGNGSETINGAQGLTLRPGMSGILTCNGAAWFAIVCAGSTQGTFTVNWDGFSTSESSTFEYTTTGNIVTLRNQLSFSATSDDTVFDSGATEVPAQLRPTGLTVAGFWRMQDNGTQALGRVTISSAGQMRLFPTVTSSTWTASGTKGLNEGQEFTYQLGN